MSAAVVGLQHLRAAQGVVFCQVQQAGQIGQVALNETAAAWMLLTAINVPVSSFPVLLIATQGALPRDRAEYDEFVQYVRRNGHLYDKTNDPANTLRTNLLGQIKNFAQDEKIRVQKSNSKSKSPVEFSSRLQRSSVTNDMISFSIDKFNSYKNNKNN